MRFPRSRRLVFALLVSALAVACGGEPATDPTPARVVESARPTSPVPTVGEADRPPAPATSPSDVMSEVAEPGSTEPGSTEAGPTEAGPTEAGPTGPAPAAAEALPSSDEGLDEDGLPRLDPALANLDAVGVGPELDNPAHAAAAGWMDFGGDGALELVAQLDYQRHTYVLLTHERGTFAHHPLVDVWLARLSSRTDPDDGVRVYRRVAARRLYEGALPSGPLDLEEYACTVASELRARDLDGDGEVELTVLAAFVRPAAEIDQECGAVAFLVGGDDLATQARFSRQYHYFHTGAGGDLGEVRDAAWQVRDLDGDGHADLQVTETWRMRDDFAGDYIGDGETAPASHSRGSDRRVLVCPWIAAEDLWRCPDGAQPGQALFVDGAARRAGHGLRPW